MSLVVNRTLRPCIGRTVVRSPFLQKHPHLTASNLNYTIPVGLHGDAGAFSNNDSLFVFSWNSLVSQGTTRNTRYVITVLKKSLITEGTMEVVSKVMGWSFNVLLSGMHPSVDWEGRTLPERGEYLAQRWRGALCQVRGDWEFFGSYLELPKWNEVVRMCWLCQASGSSNDLRYTRCDEEAPWRATRRSHEQFVAETEARGGKVAPIFRYAAGLRVECVMIDVLHTADLGITCHIIGNIIWECIVGKKWAGTTYEANLSMCTKDLDNFYRTNKTTSKLQGKLTLERVRASGDWPKLKCKAAAARHLAPFALQLAEQHLDGRRVALCTLLVRFYGIMNEEGQFLSDRAKAEFPGIGRRICMLYSQLAAESAEKGHKFWKATPKLHLFQHVCEWQGVESGNPRFYWCYADEDLVGQLIEVAEACHAKTMAVTAMHKWLTLQFSEH